MAIRCASIFFGVAICAAAGTPPKYRVLPPVVQENLSVFPIVAERTHDSSDFLTLDEGLRSGRVVVTEEGATGLVRPPRPHAGAEVNRLVLVNNSDRPLILLAGEIVTGGNQDRVVGRDRIVPAGSEPIDLSVFCVEPHRWVETSEHFHSIGGVMAQPGVRQKAMAMRDQQQVWDEVAKSRAAVAQADAQDLAGDPLRGLFLAGDARVVQHQRMQVSARCVDRCSESGAAGANDDGVANVVCHLFELPNCTCARLRGRVWRWGGDFRNGNRTGGRPDLN